MSPPKPTYTTNNTTCAFQLLHAVSIFWKDPGPGDHWLVELQSLSEAAGLRILKHRFATSTCSQFLISTRPNICGTEIVRGVKGRLRTLVRKDRPKAFQRIYDLHSTGSTTREKSENYAARQLLHHDVELDRIHECHLTDLQLINPDVDLGRYRFTSHARYCCNLHLTFRFQERFLPLSFELLERFVRSFERRLRSMAICYLESGCWTIIFILFWALNQCDLPAKWHWLT